MPAAEAGSRSGTSRPFPRAFLIAAAVLLVLRVVLGFVEKRPEKKPEAEAADTSKVELVMWQPIGIAALQSQLMKKPILYDFAAEWCGPCKKMRAEVFSDRDAAREINTRFIAVRVIDRQTEDGKNPSDVAALQKRFGITAFPTLVVDRPGHGDPIKLEGYAGKEATMKDLLEAAAKFDSTRFQ